MELNDRVKQARKHAGLTQSELAERIGIKQASISELERGLSRSSSYLVQIAGACGVNPVWLAEGIGKMVYDQSNGDRDQVVTNVSPALQPTRYFEYPEISWVQAGAAREAVQVLNSADCKRHTSDAWAGPHGFWLKVVGPSMTAPFGTTFPEGVLILVAPDIEPMNGQYVVARTKANHETTFKQFVMDAGQMFLKPLNPAFPTLEVDDTWEIVGTVVDAKWPRSTFKL